MIGYNQLEIKSRRRNWIDWLRGFTVGEIKKASPEDAKVLRVIISRLHKDYPHVRFRTKSESDTLLIIRES